MIFFTEYAGSKPQPVIRVLYQISDDLTVGSLCRIQVGFIKPKIIFGFQLIGQVHKLLLISDFLNATTIMGIQRYISTVATLLKQILRNQNYADISVLAASRKDVTHLLRIYVI